MIAHVAEAAERSGRVVFWLDPLAVSSASALQGPVALAAAFRSEIETVVIPPGPLDVSGVPSRSVRVPLASGGGVDTAAFDRLVRRCRRTIEVTALQHGVPVTHRDAAGDPVDRLAEMCLARGPWNIVALASPPDACSAVSAGDVFANVSGATALFVGPATPAPVTSTLKRIVLCVEDLDRFAAMMRAAGRMADPGGSIEALITADTAPAYDELESQIRLALGSARQLKLQTFAPVRGLSEPLLERIRRLQPGLVIARFGGCLAPDGAGLTRASALLKTPILLVR